MRVTGLDLSMTATGACHTAYMSDEDSTPFGCTHLITSRKPGDLRLPDIKAQAREIVRGSEFVLVEMLPPHMKGAGITGMVQGIIRDMLLGEGIPYADIGPSGLKKYATGKGNASKTEMALAAMKRAGLEFTNDNLCDAWWAWVAANDYLGQPVFPLPNIQRDMLKTIERKS